MNHDFGYNLVSNLCLLNAEMYGPVVPLHGRLVTIPENKGDAKVFANAALHCNNVVLVWSLLLVIKVCKPDRLRNSFVFASKGWLLTQLLKHTFWLSNNKFKQVRFLLYHWTRLGFRFTLCPQDIDQHPLNASSYIFGVFLNSLTLLFPSFQLLTHFLKRNNKELRKARVVVDQRLNVCRLGLEVFNLLIAFVEPLFEQSVHLLQVFLNLYQYFWTCSIAFLAIIVLHHTC